MTAAPFAPQPEPVSRRRGLGPRSLTARLIFGVGALVLILVLAIGASTYYALSAFLSDRLDQQLDSTVTGSLSRLYSDDYFGPLPLHNPQDVYVAGIVTGANELAWSQSPNVKKLYLTSEDTNRLAEAPPGTTATVTAKDNLEFRVVTTQPIPMSVLHVGTVPVITVVGLSTNEEHRTLSRLVRAELIIGGSALALALLATASGVRFSLRNLRRVTATANEVAAEVSPTGSGLERRVDVPDDGSEVGQLAESMNTLLSAVETQFAARLRSEDRLRQFLADASHELRTPLTSIRGYAELARMQRTAGADSDDNLSRIESEGTRMSRLVEDLLMLARGDQSSTPRQELLDVAELLDDVVSDARAAFPNRPIDAQLAAGLYVVGDPDQLYRMVRNLIGNADMHTAPGRPVLVRCELDGPYAVVQVIDGGPGLPAEESAHVFERFWRADKARSRAHGGSGLGLSIVAAIVSAHGGTVQFESSVEHGSTVTIRLPVVHT
jgi:two-component system OmpR family sensor kinase